MGTTGEGKNEALILGGGFVLAALAAVLVNLNVPPGENGGTREMIGTLAILAVVAVGLYLLLRQRAGTKATVGLVLGVLAVLTVVAFWSGLPFLLGAAAVAVGRRATDRGRLPLAAQILGAVAVLAGVVALVMDMV